MDSHSRSASPGGPARPQHRPPSPPTPTPPSPAAFDNRAYQHDDPNHNDSFASNHPQQNGHKEQNGDTKTLEAVNLELINLQPKNGNAKKKDVEVDMNATNPYDEYFVPVNEHRKYMRGEKLYVTADKRGEKGGCKRPLCWTLLGLVVAAIVALIALAATGVLFANTPTPVEQYNASVSSARALGGIGHVHHAHDHHDHDHHDHDHDHDHDDNHDHGHDHKHQHNHTQETQPDIGTEPDDATTADDEFNQRDFDNNYDSTMYVPGVMEGELKIDNEEFKAAFLDPNSDEYKHFSENFSQALKQAVLEMDGADDNGNDVTVEIVPPRKQSDVVTYRIHWKSDFNNEPNNALTPAEVKADLDKYLIRHNRMISHYHVAQEGIKVRKVLDVCQINKNDCEYGCEFDESTLDFMCTCPQDQTLDMTNPHRCISPLESNLTDDSKQKETNVRELESNPTTVKTNPEEDVNSTHTHKLKVNVFDWKETNHVKVETTTSTDPDLKFSHIFGHESNDDKVQNTETKDFKSEPEPEPSSEPEPEPASEPEPEPTSEPEPEPTSEPEPEPGPVTHEPSSEPDSELSWAPDSKTSSETEKLSSAPEAEPSSAAEPDPTSAPEPEPSSAPEHDPTSAPEPEPSSDPEPSSKPEPEPSSKPEPEPPSRAVPEPFTEPAPEPSSEPTPEPKPLADHGPSSVVEYGPKQPSLIQSEAKTVPDPKTTPEPITETKAVAESSNATQINMAINLLPEDKNEHGSEMEIMTELVTVSKPVTESATETHQVFEHEQNSETNTLPILEPVKEEFSSDAKLILDFKSAVQHKEETTTELATPEANSEEHSENKWVSELKSQYEAKSALITMESSTENIPDSESNSEPKQVSVNTFFDDSETANEMTTSSSDSSEDKTYDNDKNYETTTASNIHIITDPSNEANPDFMTILQQTKAQENNFRLISSNSDNDWLEYDRNKTSTSDSKNNTETKLFQDILLNSVNAPSHLNNTEDELSFELIAKNNEVPSEFDAEDTKTTPTPVENEVDLSVAGLDKSENNNQANQTSVTTNSEVNNSSHFDHPVTENSTKNMEITEGEQLFKPFKNMNESDAMDEEQSNENNKNTYEQENIGEEQSNEPYENSDVTFGFINSLFNRSSKSIDSQNTTNIDNVTSNTTNEENTTTTDSDWLTESATEVNYVQSYNQMEDETTVVNKLEYLMNHHMTNDDFEPDYLNNMGKATSKMAEQDVPMYVSHDYDNEEFRVKRVNVESKNNTNISIHTTENMKANEHSETTTVSQFIYKTTESVPNNTNLLNHDFDQTITSKDTNKSEPAPVWEESDSEKEKIYVEHLINSTVPINKISKNESTEGTFENTTPVNNFNVTIYEISSLNNHSFPVTKHVNTQSSEYDDHETEMNPFLPEIENNKSLVKKLQEGHDLEPTNLNDTQNDNNEDHSLPNERQIHAKTNLSTEHMNINEYTTTDPEVSLADAQNVSNGSPDAANKTYSAAENDSPGDKILLDKPENSIKEEMQSISTFLIDTDDLDRERTTAPSPTIIKKILENEASSPITLAEKTTMSSTIKADENIEFLSVVPINQDDEIVPKNNVKSENILELNDIRTLDLTK